MLRTMFWVTVWVMTLCALDINIKYADGLTINLKGWA